jgi:hypothetical protein
VAVIQAKVRTLVKSLECKMSQAIVKEEEGGGERGEQGGMGPEVEKFLIHNEINLGELWNDT